MKRLVILLFVACCSLSAMAQKSKTFPSKIEEVTVFFSGAHVTRSTDISIESGVTRCVISNMPFGIDPNTILIGGGIQATLLNVEYQINYLETQKKSDAIKALQDSLESVAYNLQTLRDKKYTLDQELDVLMNNKKMAGDQHLDPSKLEQLLNLFAKRIPAIKGELQVLGKTEKKMIEDQTRYTNQLNELNAKVAQGVPEIILTLKSERMRSFPVTISYFIQGAAWTPKYDIRVDNIHSPLHLMLKADIQNNTGENWDQVKLHLATTNPTLNQTKPTLNTWFLYAYNPYNNGYRQYNIPSTTESMNAPSMSKSYDGVKDLSVDDKEKTMMQEVSTVNGTLHMQFDIGIPYSVNGQGKVQTVEVKNYDINAIYEISSAPKLEKAAFLMARFTGADELSQLGGQAQVFFENGYVGKSYIAATSEDTLSIGLGRYNSITVDRKKLKTECSKSFLGSVRKEELKFEISLKNSGTDSVEVLVQDQIPVSTDKEVTIDLLDAKNADINETTGMLTWKVKIPPGKSVKLIFGYRVKSPSSKQYILE